MRMRMSGEKKLSCKKRLFSEKSLSCQKNYLVGKLLQFGENLSEDDHVDKG